MIQSQVETSTIGSEDPRELLFLKEGEKLDENLICHICTQLVLNPLECEDCQNIFCSECIGDWIKKNGGCIFRCPSKPMKTKQVHRFVRNALEQLRFRCKNSLSGCEALTTYEKIGQHSQQCLFEYIKCKHDGCEFKGIRQKIVEHEEDCDYQPMGCEKCGELMTRSVIGKHDCLIYLCKEIRDLRKENLSLKESQQLLENKFSQLEHQLRQIQIEKKMQTNFGLYQPYTCARYHELAWTSGQYGQCDQCKKKDMTLRYICISCKVGFCQSCRVPRIIDLCCPKSHKLQRILNVPTSIVCDICGARPAPLGITNFNDRDCDFDICGKCLKID